MPTARIALLLTLSMAAPTACTSAASQQPANRTPNSGNTTKPSPGATATPPGGSTDGLKPPQSADAKSDIDVVVVSAIGNETPNESQRQEKFFQDFLEALAQKLAGKNARVAIIASQTAAISGVSVAPQALQGFPQGATRQINFELAPKDALLGAIVAGCPADKSDLNATHAPGTITVCGQSVANPAHAWTWAVDDVKGKTADFLRAGAKRIYIVVASNDAQIISAKQFLDFTTAQNAGSAPKVHAVIPLDTGAACSDQNRRATVEEELARTSGGKAYSYCSGDWGALTAQIIDAL